MLCWAQHCPRLAERRLDFAHLAVMLIAVSIFFLRLPSVCSVDSFIQYLIHRLLCRTPFTRITFFQNPGLNTCLGLNKGNVFVSNHLFYKALFYTTPCYMQTPCFTCWACASVVCGLQNSSFHSGRRNTPEEAKIR